MKSFRLMLCAVVVICIWTTAFAEENVVSKKSIVTFTGRLHAQYHYSNVAAAEDMNNTFYIRRARLTASYKNFSGKLAGKVQFDLGEGGVKLKDGYVDLKCAPVFGLKVGQFKKPFSLWELTSSTKTMVIERGNKIIGSSWKTTNQINIKDGLYAGRDIGAMVHGKAGKLAYAVGIFNGNGYHKSGDSDNGKMGGGRFVLNALENLSFGVSASNRYVSQYGTSTGDTINKHFQAFEGDLEFGIKHHVSKSGHWVQMEGVYGSNPAISEDAKFMGVAFIGSYNVKLAEGGKIYSVRPAIRGDYSQRDLDNDDTRNILVTPGVDIFFDEYNRLQINVDIDKPLMDGADIEIGARIQIQIHI